MRKKLWIILALLFVIPGLLFTVSCAKKTVKSEAGMEQQQAQEASAQDQARQAELARQQEEAQEMASRKMAARNRFLNENIHFEFDRSNLLPEAQEILRSKAQWLQDNPDVHAVIEGHCDERGTNEYNLALGDRRANSAKAYLVDLGISGSRLTCISYGEERPLDPGHDEEAWAKNRRAQFTLD